MYFWSSKIKLENLLEFRFKLSPKKLSNNKVKDLWQSRLYSGGSRRWAPHTGAWPTSALCHTPLSGCLLSIVSPTTCCQLRSRSAESPSLSHASRRQTPSPSQSLGGSVLTYFQLVSKNSWKYARRHLYHRLQTHSTVSVAKSILKEVLQSFWLSIFWLYNGSTRLAGSLIIEKWLLIVLCVGLVSII